MKVPCAAITALQVSQTCWGLQQTIGQVANKSGRVVLCRIIALGYNLSNNLRKSRHGHQTEACYFGQQQQWRKPEIGSRGLRCWQMVIFRSAAAVAGARDWQPWLGMLADGQVCNLCKNGHGQKIPCSNLGCWQMVKFRSAAAMAEAGVWQPRLRMLADGKVCNLCKNGHGRKISGRDLGCWQMVKYFGQQQLWQEPEIGSQGSGCWQMVKSATCARKATAKRFPAQT